jgi:hypothetical protein
MPKQTKNQVLPATLPAASPSWKDHPLAVSALAVAGTITIGIILVNEIILPTRTAQLTNQITDLPKLKQSVKELTAASEEKDKQISDLKEQLQLLQQKNLFLLGNPYPTLFSKVHIGDPISALDSAYPAAKIDKSRDGYWNVELTYGAINSATYFYDENSKNKVITHVGFRLNFSLQLTPSFLQDKLIEAFGTPSKQPRAEFYEWDNLKSSVIFKSDDNYYMLLPKETRPGYWPES